MRALYAWLCANGLFPIHERIKGHQTCKLHKHLMRTQWWSEKQLHALIQQRLFHFMKQVVDEVPYYGQFSQSLAQTVGDAESMLAQWPCLTKDLIKQNFQMIKNPKAKDLVLKSTGGSSGEPLQFLLGKQRISHDVAAKWRATQWWGVDIGDPELVIWGSPIEQHSQSKLKTIRDWFLRSHFISAQRLDDAKSIRILEKIQRLKPRMLFAYPSILSHVAQIAKTLNMSFSGIQVAFVTSEMLEPFQKELIESVFNCRVANGYGGRDAGFIAHACPEGKMHLSVEDIYVEILNEQGQRLAPGEVGEIVITHMATGDFPFVRYKTGDYGSMSDKPCACGRGLAVLDRLEGRISDLIYNQNNQVVHRNEIIQLINGFENITRFRFEQLSMMQSRVQICGHLSSDQQNRLIKAFRALLGEGTKIDIECMPVLPATISGKHKFIVSHLKTEPSKDFSDVG